MKRKELIEKWLEALESGEYKQGRYALAIETPKGYEFCCLGVLCAVDGRAISRLDGWSFLPEGLAKKVGIDRRGSFINSISYRGSIYYNLAKMNDDGVRFKTIAKIIREQLEAKNFETP